LDVLYSVFDVDDGEGVALLQELEIHQEPCASAVAVAEGVDKLEFVVENGSVTPVADRGEIE
jgi:hypothetical protein